MRKLSCLGVFGSKITKMELSKSVGENEAVSGILMNSELNGETHTKMELSKSVGDNEAVSGTLLSSELNGENHIKMELSKSVGDNEAVSGILMKSELNGETHTSRVESSNLPIEDSTGSAPSKVQSEDENRNLEDACTIEPQGIELCLATMHKDEAPPTPGFNLVTEVEKDGHYCSDAAEEGGGDIVKEFVPTVHHSEASDVAVEPIGIDQADLDCNKDHYSEDFSSQRYVESLAVENGDSIPATAAESDAWNCMSMKLSSSSSAENYDARLLTDDVLAGHHSDPGVYDRDDDEDAHSYGSPVGQSNNDCISHDFSMDRLELDSHMMMPDSSDNHPDFQNQCSQLEHEWPCHHTQHSEISSDDTGELDNKPAKFIGLTESDPTEQNSSQIEEASLTENHWFSDRPDLNHVKEWINSIEPFDLSQEHASALDIEYNDWTAPFKPGESEIEEKSGTVPPPQEARSTTAEKELVNTVVKFLNPSSNVAQLSGLGLRVVPALGMFNNLKIISLAGNGIVRILSGSLPKGVHSLDLSRNRIAVIEGLRELTRLRVLDLSYNRISRIGHGLANCTLLKELRLAGNKISEVEGLHRLLKLAVLDLSLNRLTTAKSLGQIASNYSSLLALNLLGNPVHVNLGEEHLRKLVTSLVPHVVYLNKQPLKAVSAREAVVDSVARAALGNSQRYRSGGSSRASRKAGTASPTTAHSIRHSGQNNSSSRKNEKRHHHVPRQPKTEDSPQQHRHHSRHSHRSSDKRLIEQTRHSSSSSRYPPLGAHTQQQMMAYAMEKRLKEGGGIPRSRSEHAFIG